MATPAPVRESQPTAALDTLGKVVALTATAVGFIAALGFPAVAVQYHRLKIPLQFLTKDQALRAGILPAAVLGIVIYAAYFLVRHPELITNSLRKSLLEKLITKLAADLTDTGLKTRELVVGEGVLNAAFIIGRVFFNVFFTLEILFLFIRSYMVKAANYLIWRYKFDTDRTAASVFWGVFFGVLLLGPVISSLGRFGLMFTRLLTRHRSLGKNARSDVKTQLQAVGSVSLWCFLVTGLGQWEIYWYISRFTTSPIPNFDVILTAVTSGLFGISLSSFFIAIDHVLTGVKWKEGADESWSTAKSAAFVALLFLYASFVTYYASQIYQTIPYSFGGGEPTRADLWIEKKKLPETTTTPVLSAITVVTEGELVRCNNVYIVHIDSDIVVITRSQALYSPALVLPRDSVKAIKSA